MPLDISRFVDRVIREVTLADQELRFEFQDLTPGLILCDDGQDCCETRYMTCDDDLSRFVGARLLCAEVADAPDVKSSCDVHEVQFLRVYTTLGVIVCESHNEHNGYYSGFSVNTHAAEEEI